VNRRDELCQADPLDPKIPGLNNDINNAICDSSRKTFADKVISCAPRANPTKFWGLLHNLSGKHARQPPNQPISFKGKVLTKPQSIAKGFNRQYTSVGVHKQNPQSRKVIRHMRLKHKLDSKFNPFTETTTSDAIKASRNSTATGPNGLTSLHLKHLGPCAICFLTKIFNPSINSANLPAIWKYTHIIPIPKPGKPPNHSSSYRPISFLYPVVKILERLLLPFINPPSLPLSKSQHGFRTFCSTTSALLPLVSAAVNAFNERKPPTRRAVVTLEGL
jgi:hypothetical protein